MDIREDAGTDAVGSSLSEPEIQALTQALNDEYRALATYDQVLRDFGPVRPFLNIREAEARHAAALISLFERYGVPVPPNPWPNNVPRYASVRDACDAGIQSEIENAALFERLKALTTHPDILAVFEMLQSASREHHVPAFQRCTQRGATQPHRGGSRNRW